MNGMAQKKQRMDWRDLQVLASISRAHIVAIAALGTLTFGWLFTGQYLWGVVTFCALDWFVVNLLNRVVDLDEDRANAIFGTEFVARHPRLLAIVGFSTLGLSLLLGHLWLPGLTPWRLCYHTLGLTYNWPLLPGKRRIKELYFWKNTASAVGFVLTVFVYPLAAIGWNSAQFPPGIQWASILLTIGFFFLFELSYEVIYDLRDIDGDTQAGVRSYPVVHGPKGATKIIDGLLLGSLLLITAGFIQGALPWRIAVMGVAPLIQWSIYKRLFARGLRSRDCILLTWLGAGLLACYHLWILFKLPGIGSIACLALSSFAC